MQSRVVLLFCFPGRGFEGGRNARCRFDVRVRGGKRRAALQREHECSDCHMHQTKK